MPQKYDYTYHNVVGLIDDAINYGEWDIFFPGDDDEINKVAVEYNNESKLFKLEINGFDFTSSEEKMDNVGKVYENIIAILGEVDED